MGFAMFDTPRFTDCFVARSRHGCGHGCGPRRAFGARSGVFARREAYALSCKGVFTIDRSLRLIVNTP